MRIAALILGLLGGIIGLFVGFISYSGGAVLAMFNTEASGIPGMFGLWLNNPRLMQILSIAAPVAALVGGGLALSRPAVAGVLMLVGTIGMFLIFGLGSLWLVVNSFVIVPVLLCLVGAIFSLLSSSAREPAPPPGP